MHMGINMKFQVPYLDLVSFPMLQLSYSGELQKQMLYEYFPARVHLAFLFRRAFLAVWIE